MTQTERRYFLIQALLQEQPNYQNITIPVGAREQKELLRALFNIRMPRPVSDEFLRVQDEYLQREIAEKGVTDVADLTPVQDGLYLWQGDITTLKCGAVVNAANSQMLGCFVPGHTCIDNAIHTFAGVQLRAACAKLMERQGHEEPTGQAKITPAFNLPCRYVIHTVGPIVQGGLTQLHRQQLASCYRSCLELAAENGVDSIAFCCISTGVFLFPNEEAAKIAVDTVKKFRAEADSPIEVIFNVYKPVDLYIYRELLG